MNGRIEVYVLWSLTVLTQKLMRITVRLSLGHAAVSLFATALLRSQEPAVPAPLARQVAAYVSDKQRLVAAELAAFLRLPNVTSDFAMPDTELAKVGSAT